MQNKSSAGATSDAARQLLHFVTAARLGGRRTFTEGEAITSAGETDDVLHLLLDGAVAEYMGEDGQVVLGLRLPPEPLGLAAVTGEPHWSTAVALSGVVTRAVPVRDVQALAAADPAAGLALLGVTWTRLRRIDRSRVEATITTATQRLARRLLELAPVLGQADPGSGAVRLRFTQSDLAAWAGTTRESVVRALRQLRAAGTASTEHRTVLIHDLDALRLLAG
ncbi:Crp/Fnr family transcriptional regulator [Kitasatospora sp. NPDC088134]|uniref:Crp/Fnr family transcriptional regulator n=1 Tax=Kitasatospora sp. NPDC088134 TaxID=3364071 RepID=UPI00382D024B